MYNYNLIISYKNIEGNASDTAYRKAFLDAYNINSFDKDKLCEVQDHIYNKFKENEQFKKILEKAKEKYKQIIPIDMDDESTLVLLFEYNIMNRSINA